MSDLTRDVLKDFADIVIDESNKDEEVTAYGTTVESDGVDYVKLDGSSLLTPITTTTDIKPGERVLVLIKNHQAVIIGNSSNPSAGSQELNNLKETVNLDKATIKDLVANNVTINDSLKANSARIDSLEATNVEINGKLMADRADITRLDTDKLNADEADIRYAKVDELRATSADVVKLNADYAKFKDASVKRLDANEASIQDLDAKKLSAEAADIKYLTIDNAKATYLQAGDFNAYKATVETLLAAKASVEELEANYLKVANAEATYAKITELDALTGSFNTLNADLAKVEELVAKKANIEDLNAAKASIQTLQTDLTTANQLIAKKVDAEYVDSEIVKATETITDDLTAIHAIVDVLDTKYATIEQLNAAKANLETLIAKKATIEDLNAAKATIGELNGLVANINSILSGSIGTGTLQTIHLTAENVVIDDAVIKSANIEGLDVSKLNAGTISTNKFAIKSDDGGIVISGSTQQFKDKNNKVRLQIGKDAQGNFNFIVFGEDGSTAIYNQNGITKQAVPDGLIVDQMVADNAAIQAKKVQFIDKDGSKTLQTYLTTEQGKIESLIKETTIDNGDGTTTSLKDAYNQTKQTVEGNTTTIANIQTTVNDLTGDVESMDSRITTVETTADGLKTTVSKASSDASSALTSANQTASKFSWIVKSGTSATDFTLTDRSASLVADYINLNGKVTFSGLDSSAQNKINTAQSTANSANSKIDNLQIGGRNLIISNNAVDGYIYSTGSVISSNEYKASDYIPVTPGDILIFQLWSPIVARVWIDDTYFDSDKNYITGYDGSWYDAKMHYIIKVIVPNNAAYVRFSYTWNNTFKYKLEKGNKATDWTPAPEDKANQSIIDNWAKDSVVNGETVINGGYIKTNTIKTDHLDVDDIFATGSSVMNIINAQEINANRITSGLLSAERINAYGLSILNKTTNQQTFNISNNGEVTIRGSVSSGNYVESKTGWTINNDGTAEFNDIIARGSVITNDGGIVSAGGSGRNLQLNTSFYNGLTSWSRGDKYSVDTGFQYKLTNTVKFERSSLTEDSIQWLYSGSNVIRCTVGKSYTAQANFYTKDSSAIDGSGVIFGIYFYTSDSSSAGTFRKKISFTNNQWVHETITAVAPQNAVYVAIVVGAYRNGTFWMAQPKLEEGDVATDWSLAPEDKTKQVRFWAGSSYEERESAPWIVYSEGSMKATQGEFSGVFSGTVDIGNIKIADPSSTAGGDALLTIQNGQNGIKRVQLTDTSASRFAQDIIIADDHDADKISLKQDGTAVVGTGINVSNNVILNGKSLIMNNNELTTTDDGVSYLFKSNVTLGTSVSSANLIVNGNANMNDVTVNEHLYFGNNVKITKVSNGVNIDVIK